MKLVQHNERPARLKAVSVLGVETPEIFSFGVNIQELVEENKQAFIANFQREGITPLYRLQQLEVLSVLDPTEFERIIAADSKDFDYYRPTLKELAISQARVSGSIRFLSRVFPESRSEMEKIQKDGIERFFRLAESANLSEHQLMELVSSGVTLLFLLPDRQAEVKAILQSNIPKLLDSPGENWTFHLGILKDCYIACPGKREIIRSIVKNQLPQMRKWDDLGDNKFSFLSSLKVIESDTVAVSTTGRLELSKIKPLSRSQQLPERNLAA